MEEHIHVQLGARPVYWNFIYQYYDINFYNDYKFQFTQQISLDFEMSIVEILLEICIIFLFKKLPIGKFKKKTKLKKDY